MRHGNKVNALGRKYGHRKALLKNLANALIQHKRINTTLAKAKSLRQYIEPLVTKSRENTTHSRRVVFSYLQNKEAVKELFGTIAERIGDRPGGYVRVIKTGFRRGDGAETAMIEFVDFNDVYNKEQGGSKSGKTRRSRRRGGSGGGANVAATATAATAAAVVAEEITAEEEE
ncbi:MAG: 50S ribosomal protein L17 [Lewinellaceae bacterium]|nr:50S ribosomal protein L17 [Lewinella sp.]MCB9279700.1 50S ribosomal protein L17 [Lewinellaceae bacterium]